MWLLIDNYDSFTYVLHHYLLATGNECLVVKNDELSVQGVIDLNPERIIISPGPETPQKAGISLPVIQHFYDKLPILGICLGHQALGVHFGAQLLHAPYPMHGKTASIRHNHHPIFAGIPAPATVMRYHSLVIDTAGVPGLQQIAHTVEDNICMAIAHEQYPVLGLQFHPESVGTPMGQQMISNWSKIYAAS